LEDFKFYDPVLTTQSTLRDFMAHRTGFPTLTPYILASQPAKLSAKELFRYLARNKTIGFHQVEKFPCRNFRHFRPIAPFRSLEPLYNNMIVGFAGHVLEEVTDLGFADLLRSLIFAPLNMTSSSLVDSTGNGLAEAYSLDSNGEMKAVNMNLMQ
jgi:CubicO group peptidase (beta-lactamase class C family)